MRLKKSHPEELPGKNWLSHDLSVSFRNEQDIGSLYYFPGSGVWTCASGLISCEGEYNSLDTMIIDLHREFIDFIYINGLYTY